VWFQAIDLLTQSKKGVSAMHLHRQLGISYNAAWRMKHTLMQAMLERDGQQRLSGLVQLDDAYLGGERSGGGRAAVEKDEFYWVNTVLGNLKTALRSSYHSFDAK